MALATAQYANQSTLILSIEQWVLYVFIGLRDMMNVENKKKQIIQWSYWSMERISHVAKQPLMLLSGLEG